MSIQRYDVVGYGQQDIVRSETGEFVDFDDHCKEINRLTRKLAKAKARIAELEVRSRARSTALSSAESRVSHLRTEVEAKAGEVEKLRDAIDWLAGEIRMVDLFNILGAAPLQGAALLFAIDAAQAQAKRAHRLGPPPIYPEVRYARRRTRRAFALCTICIAPIPGASSSVATKDITDLEVLRAVRDRAANRNGPRLCELLSERTGQPVKACLRAIERVSRRGLIDYGVSLGCPWLTEDGRALLDSDPGA